MMFDSILPNSPRLVIMTMAFAALLPQAASQQLTVADVEQHLRTSWDAWNSGDPARIAEVEEMNGFGYRTRNPAPPQSKAARLASIKAFLSSMEYFRVTPNRMETAVDGDVGLAWGFFTEEFQVRGRSPESVVVRFSITLKKEKTGWRRLLFHRDIQTFDANGQYIPVPAASR